MHWNIHSRSPRFTGARGEVFSIVLVGKSDRRFRAACGRPLGRDQAPQNCLICTVSDTEASVSVEHLSTTLAAICGYLACCRPPSRSANLLSDRGGRLADALGCSA